jgi:type IV pilus assembly protein PilN
MKIRVNLLPHRAERRERQKKAFFALTGVSLVAGLALVGFVWSVLQGQIADQRSRNEFISSENRKLDLQIREIATLREEIESLRSRQRAVEDLQADRNQPVYLMDELARQVPEGIYLRTIRQDDKKVSVTGFAASNERVSEFLRNLQSNSKFLERPELAEIRVSGAQAANVARRLFEFSLSFTLRPTPERVELQQQGKPAAPAKPPAPSKPAAAPGSKA